MFKIEFSQRQIKILILFCFALILMISSYAICTINQQDATVNSNFIYTIERNSVKSNKKNINWENTFGGSQDEEIISSFFINNNMYYFGNTNSKDNDFKEDGTIYLAIINKNGTTKKFLKYGPSYWKLKKVCIISKGFLLGIETKGNNGDIKLLIVDLSGNIINESNTTFSSSHDKTILDMYNYTDNLNIIIYKSKNIIGNLCEDLYIYCLNDNLNIIYNSVSKNSLYQISYINSFLYQNIDKISIFANVSYQSQNAKKTFLVKYDYELGGQIEHITCNRQSSYIVEDIIPYKTNYAVLIKENSKGILLILDNTFNIKNTEFLQYNCNDLYFINLDKDIYILILTNNKSFLYYASNDLTSFHSCASTMAQNITKFINYYIFQNKIYLTTLVNCNIKILIINNKNNFNEIIINGNFNNPCLLFNYNINKIYLNAQVLNKKDCLTHFFGGANDIWISELI